MGKSYAEDRHISAVCEAALNWVKEHPVQGVDEEIAARTLCVLELQRIWPERHPAFRAFGNHRSPEASAWDAAIAEVAGYPLPRFQLSRRGLILVFKVPASVVIVRFFLQPQQELWLLNRLLSKGFLRAPLWKIFRARNAIWSRARKHTS